ncbi:hypothetical protein A2Y85_01735 [candidate division WOR-3 bacterium RBG_13_43_14]|uniref:Secretion system C-terminal sorting domain-containing protein n=1 Tax=candidate division WOR-3 bacterium RBG_13_43_14 TaxID=1802590 RepID=A0A1F4U1Q9_UNCW3|nr:MAG: hypothetical protein A2Y85_01735 [candidate division WOR-3 bacterium RBG_13_43_14]
MKYLAFNKTKIYDSGGNNNGRLDPGETVNLTAFLKNTGGADFTNLNTTIQCSDAYITITDNAGNFGLLAIDSIKENVSDPYTIRASATTPQGHSAYFRLIAVDGAFCDTFEFDVVIGTYHYMVWNPDPTGTPGLRADSILRAIGYSGVHVTNMSGMELGIYQAIFVCVGIYPSNYIITNNGAEATMLVNYLNNGGRMYLEGGDVWYYDPPYQGGHDFGPLFGIYPSADGSSDLGPVLGQSGTFTNGMNFTYSGENSYMDHIDPTGTGFLVFVDSDNSYNCGVANDVSTYRTVGTSFELGALVDAGGNSTRAALLDSIMHFFGISLIAIEEQNQSCASLIKLQVFPNPGSGYVMLQWPVNASVESIRIIDATGRIINDLKPAANSNSIRWNGVDAEGRKASGGIYFAVVENDNSTSCTKFILIQ